VRFDREGPVLINSGRAPLYGAPRGHGQVSSFVSYWEHQEGRRWLETDVFARALCGNGLWVDALREGLEAARQLREGPPPLPSGSSAPLVPFEDGTTSGPYRPGRHRLIAIYARRPHGLVRVLRRLRGDGPTVAVHGAYAVISETLTAGCRIPGATCPYDRCLLCISP
jgi:hypothetical protein